VRLLGLDTLRALVVSLNLFEQVDPRVAHRFGLGRVWRHAAAAAALGRLIAYLQGASPECAAEAFSASLLHDVGKLVLAQSLPDDYAFVLHQAEAERRPTWVVEAEWLGATHAEVGAYLLGLWGVPGSIVEAVARHHRPALDEGPSSYFPLAAVHVANAIEHQLHPADVVGAAATLDEEYLARYDLAGRVPVWTAACFALAEEAAGKATRPGIQ
jgi:HD-like signal output (HDOD) protein